MKAVKVVGKSGKTYFLPHIPKRIKSLEDDEIYGQGWCVACGNTQGGCEPDARGYKCESCGEHKVYGIEELVVMGWTR